MCTIAADYRRFYELLLDLTERSTRAVRSEEIIHSTEPSSVAINAPSPSLPPLRLPDDEPHLDKANLSGMPAQKKIKKNEIPQRMLY